jgi:hypothetical protein
MWGVRGCSILLVRIMSRTTRMMKYMRKISLIPRFSSIVCCLTCSFYGFFIFFRMKLIILSLVFCLSINPFTCLVMFPLTYRSDQAQFILSDLLSSSYYILFV